jgi:hypothetical protein
LKAPKNKNERRAWFLLQLTRVIQDLDGQGFNFMPFDFYRTLEDEAQEFKEGKSSVRVGFHQVWQAVDLVQIKDGLAVWNDGPGYEALQVTARKYGLFSGRSWKKPKDSFHVQSPLGAGDVAALKGDL